MTNFQNQQEVVKEITITRCPVPTAASLALDLGLLNQELGKSGCVPSELTKAKNLPLHHAHFNHSIPFLVREGGNIPALWARSTGKDTRLVGLSWVDEYQAILTLPDSNILGPSDLHGRRIGIPRHRYLEIDFRAAQALRGFHNALSLVNYTLDDVKIVDLEGINEGRRDTWNTEMEALHRREVDAIFVKGATGLQIARTAGTKEVIELGFHPNPLVRVNNGVPRTVTVDTALTKQTNIVEHILTSLLRAADWSEKHPDDFIRVVTNETGASSEYVGAAYRNISLRPKLSEDYLNALDAQCRFLLEHGFLPNSVNVWEWSLSEPLIAAEKNVNKGVSI
ncbi:ABC transporter substrate-binding protein [Bacillus salipaludis]|uniref:ABC transporter substrate-binding protein n=1 Tax=Bacillus salipaludis TaxID=2547811 RepID=UPI002E23C888|nr:ABC transporter substrate-binding protein [Bacillus salipaludis]